MRIEFYLDNFSIDFSGIHEKYINDPIRLTACSKVLFENKYYDIARRIKEALEYNAEVIHIKNIKRKSYYDVLTPYSGKVQPKGLTELIYQMYSVIGITGTFPILYKEESTSILRAVAPRYNSHNEHSSQSPYQALDWHVDAAYRPLVKKDLLSPLPDYLIFGIVHKGHENLPIIYITLNDILNRLSNKDISVGLKKEFAVSSPDSFSDKITSNNVPLLVKNKNGSFYSRIAFQYAKPLTKRAAYFLEKVKDIAKQENIRNIVNIECGDIVIINNKITLHKRDGYNPKWDGKDRYFIRIYSVKDLEQGILSNKKKKWIWT